MRTISTCPAIGCSNPSLKGKPVVVLSNNDGCCVARSNEVKTLGVKMGTPWFQLYDLAKQHGIIPLSSNYGLYGDVSQRFMQILAEFSPVQEVYSIDECFLDFAGFGHLDLTGYGQTIRQRVLQWLGLPVCVGIAPRKHWQNWQSRRQKARTVSRRVRLFTPQPEQQDELLSGIEAGEVWGIGHRLSERLGGFGIETVKDLRDADTKTLRRQFSVVVERHRVGTAWHFVSGFGRSRPAEKGNHLVAFVRQAGRQTGRPATSRCELHCKGRRKAAAAAQH